MNIIKLRDLSCTPWKNSGLSQRLVGVSVSLTFLFVAVAGAGAGVAAVADACGVGAVAGLRLLRLAPQSGQKTEFACTMLPQEGHRRSCCAGAEVFCSAASLRLTPHWGQKRCSPMTSAPQLGQVVRIIEAGAVVPCPAVPSATFAPHEGHTAVPSSNLVPQILHFCITVSLYNFFYRGVTAHVLFPYTPRNVSIHATDCFHT